MKKGIMLLALVFILSYFFTAYIFEKPPTYKPVQVSSVTEKEFMIGAMDNALDFNYTHIANTLHMNTWMKYVHPDEGWLYTDGNLNTNDVWNGNPALFQSTVTGWVASNNSAGLRTVMDRPIIEYLSYGQRSDYQAEKTHTDPDYWFYTYETSIDETINVNDDTDPIYGNVGKHCIPNASQGAFANGYILSDLRANREQANRWWADFQSDSMYTWYVKPRIRVDPDFVQNNENDPICRIEILNWNEGNVKQVDILGKHFKDGTGNYDGRYIEDYNFAPNTDTLIVNPGWLLCPGDRKEFWNWSDEDLIETDFRVYWYGTCEMWIDYVRVENEPSVLLHGTDYLDDIEREVNWALAGYNPSNPVPNNFYIEEYEFNITPSLKRVNELIEYYSDGKLSLMTAYNYDLYRVHIPDSWSYVFDENDIKKYLLDETGIKHLLYSCYPLEGWEGTESDIPLTTPIAVFSKSYHPYTLLNEDYSKENGVLSDKANIQEYEEWLQELLDDPAVGGTKFISTMKFMDRLTKLPNLDINFINLHQSHLHWAPTHKLKEPSNEEIELMADLAITYGARGQMYFAYQGWGDISDSSSFYMRGLTETRDPNTNIFPPRTSNVYGQNKFSKYAEINAKYEKWGPHLMKFDDVNRHSYIYRLTNERSLMSSGTFIDSLNTYYPYSIAPDPITPDLDAMDFDTQDDVFLQASFFEIAGETDINKYFMIVNRRCSPYIGNDTYNNMGGRRLVAFYPKAAHLPGFNNWKVINLEDSSTVWTFDKNSNSPVYIGDFMPGEGKLFKISPVMQEGGTFVTDENVGLDVICKDTVVTDGFDLQIPIGRTIQFKEDVKVIMEGGNFYSCLQGTPTEDDINLVGYSGAKWFGFELTDCDTVKIDNTIVTGIEDYDPPTQYYAFDMANCKYVRISESAFTGYNTGAARAYYTSSTNVNVVINGNNFSMSNNDNPVISISGSSSMSLPLVIDDNYFNISSTSTSQAIVVTNISGAVIKNNSITNYSQPILAFSSSIDFYNNDINTSSSDFSVVGSSGSNLNMAPGYRLNAGYNEISNSHEDASNILVSGSYFVVNGGYNTFDLSGSIDQGKHFTGYFPGSSETPYPLHYNCFTFGQNDTTPIANVTWGSLGPPVTFAWNYDCNVGEGAGYSSKMENEPLIIHIMDDYYDTIDVRQGYESPTVSDSMYIEMRKRNYGNVIDLAERIIETSPESIEAHDAISKLYLASLRLDSSGSRIAPLKEFLEELILNNGENAGLVARAFYFIQKCKAALGDYQSALAGFEDIINNNPNTYEALVASWDYSATSLLMNGGTGGARRIWESEDQLFAFNSFNDDPVGKNDRSKLTKDEKQKIRTNITKTFEETRKEEINKINKLKEKSDKGDRNARRELKRREILQVTIEKRQPDNIREHINAVSSDIQKVFNSTEDNVIKKEIDPIPQDYELSQNFPNPFNPTTKIRYALPREGKVQIVIFDILGREVAKLVNNEFNQAGRYVKEFDGSRLSSGIYLYRILVNDGKDFTQVKKMVLVK